MKKKEELENIELILIIKGMFDASGLNPTEWNDLIRRCLLFHTLLSHNLEKGRFGNFLYSPSSGRKARICLTMIFSSFFILQKFPIFNWNLTKLH